MTCIMYYYMNTVCPTNGGIPLYFIFIKRQTHVKKRETVQTVMGERESERRADGEEV